MNKSCPELIKAMPASTVDNPYWDAVKNYVFEDKRPWCSEYQIDIYGIKRNESDSGKLPYRDKCVKKYSWTISDPATLQFVVNYCDGHKILDPLAGTGYWAFLLNQYGIDILCCDKDPFNNRWHAGATLHSKIVQQDAVDAVRFYQNRTLLLSWIPYNDPLGTSILNHYSGNRIIYIGENKYGCCADNDFFCKARNWLGQDCVSSSDPMVRNARLHYCV